MIRALLAGLLAMAAAAQTDASELRRRVEAGLKAKAAGELDTAIREFERVVELAPGLAAAHVNLGTVLFERKLFEKAAQALRRALELDSNLPGAGQLLGTALLAMGAWAEAMPHLEKAKADGLLGIALLDGGRPRDAVERLEAALLSLPDDPDLLYYLSLAHSQLSQQLYSRLRNHPGGKARAEQLLGEAMAAAGDRVTAEKHFRAALAARPDLRGVRMALGELFFSSGDYQQAEAEFRAETALLPASAAAAYKLGHTLAQLGKTKEAAAELRRAFQLRPDMPETSLELGKALASAGDLAGAEQALRRVVELEPDSALSEAARLQLSQVYRRMGRASEADREIKALEAQRAKRGNRK